MCSSNDIKESIEKLSDKLDEHIVKFEQHEHVEIERHKAYVYGQQANLAAIKDLSEKTHGMVEAWDAAQGAVRVGATLGKLAKWISGFAVGAAALSYFGIEVPK